MEGKVKKQKKIKEIIDTNRRWILLLIALLILIYLIESIFENEIGAFDNAIYHYISMIISTGGTIFFKIITEFGAAFVIIPICLICVTTMKDKRKAMTIVLNLVIIFVLNQLLKQVFERPRPTEFRLIEESGYSFPSGHSMVSMAFYGFIIYLLAKEIKKPVFKYISCISLSILILLIGISRIYLGVHYASDVIGGFCFSIGYLTVFTKFYRDKKKIEIE